MRSRRQILRSGDRGGKQARRIQQDTDTYLKGSWVRKDQPASSNLKVTYISTGKKRMTKRQRRANVQESNLILIADRIIADLKAESFR
jgi:hypothetical protein